MSEIWGGIVMAQRSNLTSNLCRFGCIEIKGPHHLFVDCPRFEEWRVAASQDIETQTARKLDVQKITAAPRDRIIQAAKSLFRDDSGIWLLGNSSLWSCIRWNFNKA
ncbi:hypothetical protein B0H10DRAFT_2332028 [Mycena sp. CBHHK59/15]|nr:hypothetical protein B0H10DRAFT_2332028 [Mycena sp. CBHHK59/15]